MHKINEKRIDFSAWPIKRFELFRVFMFFFFWLISHLFAITSRRFVSNQFQIPAHFIYRQVFA